MNQLKTIGVFEQGLTKSEIKTMANRSVELVLEQGNALAVAESLSAMENFIKEVKSDSRFTDYVREEAVKTPKGFVSASGAKIEIAEVGTKYDFSQCNDYDLGILEAKFSAAEDALKARKEFLKVVPDSGMDIITSEGEAIKVFKPSKVSSSSYKVTLSNK